MLRDVDRELETAETLTEKALHTYRVWMKDGYASLQNARSEAVAKAMAIKAAVASSKEVRMSPSEFRAATTVDYAERLN